MCVILFYFFLFKWIFILLQGGLNLAFCFLSPLSNYPKSTSSTLEGQKIPTNSFEVCYQPAFAAKHSILKITSKPSNLLSSQFNGLEIDGELSWVVLLVSAGSLCVSVVCYLLLGSD